MIIFLYAMFTLYWVINFFAEFPHLINNIAAALNFILVIYTILPPRNTERKEHV